MLCQGRIALWRSAPGSAGILAGPWAYCHVPHGSTTDFTTAIEAQIERFAPGFHDVILARHTVARLNPYATPDPRVFLCSSSTPPSGGVHGLCGHFAAKAVLRLSGGGGDEPRPYDSLT